MLLLVLLLRFVLGGFNCKCHLLFESFQATVLRRCHLRLQCIRLNAAEEEIVLATIYGPAQEIRTIGRVGIVKSDEKTLVLVAAIELPIEAFEFGVHFVNQILSLTDSDESDRLGGLLIPGVVADEG